MRLTDLPPAQAQRLAEADRSDRAPQPGCTVPARVGWPELVESSGPDTLPSRPGTAPPLAWRGDVTRVPYWVYRDQDLLQVEQEAVFEGPVWNFLCLEDEIANPGDWRTTVVGRMPVVVARDTNGSIGAFENRCAHRGALICLDNAGIGAEDFQCIYHAWRYDLRGNLKSVAFRHGVNGKGGMPPEFRVEQHGPRQLRV